MDNQVELIFPDVDKFPADRHYDGRTVQDLVRTGERVIAFLIRNGHDLAHLYAPAPSPEASSINQERLKGIVGPDRLFIDAGMVDMPRILGNQIDPDCFNPHSRDTIWIPGINHVNQHRLTLPPDERAQLIQNFARSMIRKSLEFRGMPVS